MDNKERLELNDIGGHGEEAEAMLPGENTPEELHGKQNNIKHRTSLDSLGPHVNRDADPECNYNKKCGRLKYDKTWNEAWLEFCTETSFHGLKQITQPQPFILRRLLWLVLVLLGTGLFLYQMISGIIYYYSYPVSVNVKINHNDSIRFPAITICNQNAFRMSLAADRDWYELLSRLFLDHGTNRDVDLNVSHDLMNQISLHEIYNVTSHSKEDMIMNCRWDGRPCSPDDFIPIFTDYGVCYTFNSGKDGNIKQASRTGTEGGLKLTLNVEQYEYMVGPNSGAGLKVLVHTQEEHPLVREFGVAVPPGSQTFLGMTLVRVDNLPEPHGKCREHKLKYHNTYSKSNCLKENLHIYLQVTCGCRHIDMPDNDNGLYPPCSMNTYFHCILPAIDTFNLAISKIDCPVSCLVDSHELFNSIGYISNFDALNMLQSNLTQSLGEKLAHSLEVTQKVNNKIVEDDTKITNNIRQLMTSIDRVFDDISSNVDSIRTELDIMFVKLDKRLQFHLTRGIERVKYIMEHDFVRGWTILEERTLPFLTINCLELVFSFNHITGRVIEAFGTDKYSLALSQWFNLENRFHERLDVAQRLRANVSEVNDCYNTGRPLLRFLSSLNRRYDMSYITLDLLRADISSEEQDAIYGDLFEEIDSFEDAIQRYLGMGLNITQNITVTEKDIEDTRKQFRRGCIQYNYKIFLYKTRVVDRPVDVITEIIEEFGRVNRTLNDAYEDLLRSLISLADPIHKMREGAWKTLDDAMTKAELYLVNASISKYDIMKLFTSKQINEAIHDLENAFDEMRLYEKEFHEKLVDLKVALFNMWYNLLKEYSTRGFYQKVNKDFQKFKGNPEFYYPYFADLLDIALTDVMQINDNDLEYMLNADLYTMDLTNKITEIKNKFSTFEGKANLGDRIDNTDENLFLSLSEFRDSLSKFKKDIKVDSKFYLTNFIRLDIYMQELSYEEIIQQPAYELLNLLGDIGGSIGLFLGASAMTMAEIFDVLFLQASRLWVK